MLTFSPQHGLAHEVFGTHLGVTDEGLPEGLQQAAQFLFAAVGAVLVCTIEVQSYSLSFSFSATLLHRKIFVHSLSFVAMSVLNLTNEIWSLFPYPPTPTVLPALQDLPVPLFFWGYADVG